MRAGDVERLHAVERDDDDGTGGHRSIIGQSPDGVNDTNHTDPAIYGDRQLLEELYAADTIVIGTPMYNWTVPAVLKAWIDHITFPWVTLNNPPTFVFTARGGSYAAGTPRGERDHQEPYLRHWFSAMGVTDITFVHSEYTLAGVMPPLDKYIGDRDEMHSAALARARELAGLSQTATVR